MMAWVRMLAALRNEVEAAAEAGADLLSEYRAAVDASLIAAEVAALQSIKGCAFALAAAFGQVVSSTASGSGQGGHGLFGLAPSCRGRVVGLRAVGGMVSGAGNALRKWSVEGSWCYAADGTS